MEATILASGTYMLVAGFVCGAWDVEGTIEDSPYGFKSFAAMLR
jgi:hypothetical protein